MLSNFSFCKYNSIVKINKIANKLNYHILKLRTGYKLYYYIGFIYMKIIFIIKYIDHIFLKIRGKCPNL